MGTSMGTLTEEDPWVKKMRTTYVKEEKDIDKFGRLFYLNHVAPKYRPLVESMAKEFISLKDDFPNRSKSLEGILPSLHYRCQGEWDEDSLRWLQEMATLYANKECVNRINILTSLAKVLSIGHEHVKASLMQAASKGEDIETALQRDLEAIEWLRQKDEFEF